MSFFWKNLLLLPFFHHYLFLLLLFQTIMIMVIEAIVVITLRYLVHENLLVPVDFFIFWDKFLVHGGLSHHEASNLDYKMFIKFRKTVKREKKSSPNSKLTEGKWKKGEYSPFVK